MKRRFWSGLLIAAAIADCTCVHGQSNVYSLAIYATGNSWADICSLNLPFPPYQYRLTMRSWCENANGQTIVDIGHKRTIGDVARELLEVQCGSNSFSVPLDSGQLKREFTPDLVEPGTEGSGDLAGLLIQCVTNRGGHVTGIIKLAAPMNWVLHSLENQDLIVVDGNHFTELQESLKQTFGAPDSTIRSSTSVGNGRSLTYTPQQIGVLLNVAGDSTHTIVSAVGRRKP
jgi:hypothetical protein